MAITTSLFGGDEKEPLPFHQIAETLLGDNIADKEATVTIGIPGGSEAETLYSGPMTKFVNLLCVVRTFIKDDDDNDAKQCRYMIEQLAHNKLNILNTQTVVIYPTTISDLTKVFYKQKLLVKGYDLSNPVDEYYSHFTDVLEDWFHKFDEIPNKNRFRIEVVQQ